MIIPNIWGHFTLFHGDLQYKHLYNVLHIHTNCLIPNTHVQCHKYMTCPTILNHCKNVAELYLHFYGKYLLLIPWVENCFCITTHCLLTLLNSSRKDLSILGGVSVREWMISSFTEASILCSSSPFLSLVIVYILLHLLLYYAVKLKIFSHKNLFISFARLIYYLNC